MILLRPGVAYHLAGMHARLWEVPHREFGRPRAIVGLYLGNLTGARTWHLFEIWKDGRERGVVMMADADLQQLTVTEVAP